MKKDKAKSEIISFEEAKKNIGLKVQKFRNGSRTPKPFASGKKTNTIKDVINHPQLNVPAYTFYEDNSYVSTQYCIPIPKTVPTPHEIGAVVKLLSNVYVERQVELLKGDNEIRNFSNCIGRLFKIKNREILNNNSLCYRLIGGFVVENGSGELIDIFEILIPHSAVEVVDTKEYFNYDVSYWLNKRVIKPINFHDAPFGFQTEFVRLQNTGVCNCTPVIGESCKNCEPLLDFENNVIKTFEA